MQSVAQRGFNRLTSRMPPLSR